MGNPPAWHPDPTGRHEHRYWDGERWTDHVADAGQAATDPLEGGGPAQGGAQSPADETFDSGIANAPVQEPATGTPPGSGEPTEPLSAGPPGGPPPSTGGPTFPSAQPATNQPAAGGNNGPAVAALILGILSLLVGFIPFVGLLGTIGGIAAIVLGIIGRRKAKHNGASGGGMAVAGIVTGALAIVLSLAITIGSALFFQTFSSDFGSLMECLEQTGDQQLCEQEFERSLLDRFN